MAQHIYRIYSHADADGGIAAAIFKRHLASRWTQYGWKFKVVPVNHGPSHGDWSLREIHWPCAILDFSLHPSLFSERFHAKREGLARTLGGAERVPPCTWIDHHPTGASYPFLNAGNLAQVMPEVRGKWDVSAVSTPGLFRTHHAELGLPSELIAEFEEFIDLAEVIDGALFATAEDAHDFEAPAVKLQSLFTPNHPALDRNALYVQLVRQIAEHPRVEDFLGSDPLFPAIVASEEGMFEKQRRVYRKVTRLEGEVAVADFFSGRDFEGLGRFLPYLLFPEAKYAVHVLPAAQGGVASVSCGINPWNKTSKTEKDLGDYFARHFGGGGHSFVAGGRIGPEPKPALEALLAFLNG